MLHNPLEMALTRAKEEFEYMEKEAHGLVKFMDSIEAYKELVAYNGFGGKKRGRGRRRATTANTQAKTGPMVPLKSNKNRPKETSCWAKV